jgi:hypothetical protein
VTLASPLIFFYWGSYKNISLGTFQYHLILWIWLIIRLVCSLLLSLDRNIRERVHQLHELMQLQTFPCNPNISINFPNGKARHWTNNKTKLYLRQQTLLELMSDNDHFESDSCFVGPESGPALRKCTFQDPRIPLQEAPSHIYKPVRKRLFLKSLPHSTHQIKVNSAVWCCI